MSVEQNATAAFKTLPLALCGIDPSFLINLVIFALVYLLFDSNCKITNDFLNALFCLKPCQVLFQWSVAIIAQYITCIFITFTVRR